MAIDYHHLKTRAFRDVRQRYRAQDTMLYALSLGIGQDPLDEAALPFVYEGHGGPRVLPTLAAVLGYPGFWAREPDTGIDWVRVLHGEQALQVHRPLPAEGEVVGKSRVTHVCDKGEGRGALVVVERVLSDAADGTPYATLTQLAFCRGDGGYSTIPAHPPEGVPSPSQETVRRPEGASAGQPSDPPPPALAATPADREPERWFDHPTRPEAALLYRLLADDNPLHADPAVARAGGFERPILHGLASYGIAAYALTRLCAGADPSRLRSLAVRFASPVFPGETLRTEVWGGDGRVQFRVRALERDRVVLSHGQAEIASA